MWVAGHDISISKINCKYTSTKHLKNTICNSNKTTKVPGIKLTNDVAGEKTVKTLKARVFMKL